MNELKYSLLRKPSLAFRSAVNWPQVAGALNINRSMLYLVKDTQSGIVSPILETLSANVLHHSSDTSRCAGSVIVAHISGGSALDRL